MVVEYPPKQQAEYLVRLLKRGDTSSLAQLRHSLNKTRQELALEVGVPEQTLELWENGIEHPSGIQWATWRIKLGSYVDGKIYALLGTEDSEVSAKFWALIWELVD
jgi:DNA-binding XRE family transcriptional regulator